MPQTTPREDCTRWITKGRCSFGGMRILARPEHVNSQVRNNLVHSLQRIHRNEIRKGDWKGSDGGGAKAHQNLLVNVRQGKQTDDLVKTQRNDVARREIHVIISTFPNVQNSNLKANAIRRLQITCHRMMNDRRNYGKLSRMTRPNSEWHFIISRTNTYVLKKGKKTYTWSHRGQDLEISEIRTLQHSRKDLWHGLRSWKKGKEISLDFTQERVHNSRFAFWESTQFLQTQSREQCVFTFYDQLRKRENSLWTQELHFIWWVKMICRQNCEKRFENQRIHLLFRLHLELLIQLKKQQYMFVIWTCLFKPNYWKYNPQYFRC